MAKLIGNNPSQIPTNGDLGSMAFEDRKNYATVGSSIHQPFRNIIINGDMSIAQRGTSVTGITSGASGTVRSVDRMALALSGAGTWTVSQETDAPSGQGFTKSLKFLCTTNQSSISSGGYITFIQKFEGQNLQYLKFGTSNAQSLTASFWIKSSKTGNFIVELADRDNGKYIGQLVSINTANTWEKKTVTFQGNTANSFNNDNGQSLDIQIWFGSGTSFTSGTLQSGWQGTQANRAAGINLQLHDTTNANVYLTGVQLEVGSTASDFEFLPHDVNRERCYRYYQKWDSLGQLYFLVGHVWSTTLCQYAKTFYPNFRAHPSIEYAGTLRNLSSTSAVDLSSLTIDSASSTEGQGRAGKINGNMSSSGFTSGNSCALLINSNGAYVALDAEL